MEFPCQLRHALVNVNWLNLLPMPYSKSLLACKFWTMVLGKTVLANPALIAYIPKAVAGSAHPLKP